VKISLAKFKNFGTAKISSAKFTNWCFSCCRWGSFSKYVLLL